MSDHICCNHGLRKKDQVFIETKNGEGWRRLSKDKVKPNHTIIMCACCREKPAVTMDHSHPWCDDFTLCADCEKKTFEEKYNRPK